MNPNRVFICVHNRNPDLWENSTLVFKTLRTGFPNAEIVVYSNNLSQMQLMEVRELCNGVHAKFQHIPQAIPFHAWMWQIFQQMLNSEIAEPFWFVDTDIIFWDSMEKWKFDTTLAGRFVPKFGDSYTKCITMPRLHTSMLRMDPVKLRAELDTLLQCVPNDTPHNPFVNPIFPFWHISPEGPVEKIFYDVAAMLSYAVSLTHFTAKHLDCFSHLQCGTFSDLLEPHGHEGMVARQKAMIANPESARGIWRDQDKWLNHHAIK